MSVETELSVFEMTQQECSQSSPTNQHHSMIKKQLSLICEEEPSIAVDSSVSDAGSSVDGFVSQTTPASSSQTLPKPSAASIVHIDKEKVIMGCF